MSDRTCSACGTALAPDDVACRACGRAVGNEDETALFERPPAPSSEGVTLPAEPRPSASRPLPQVPGYEVLEELGRGGMGVVYKARQVFPRRLVALKMILGGDLGGSDRLQRFRAEIAAAARLQHPHIVTIHEVGEHNGRPFFSMEYVAGDTLAHLLTHRTLSPDESATLVEQLADAVQHAHERGIIHRDLKPANVLLSVPSSSFQVLSGEGTAPAPLRTRNLELTTSPKVSDFGLAKMLESAASVAVGPQTQSGAILGTPSYMAPEQAGGRSKEIGPATDVWALGAILYECLTGRAPFQAPTSLDTLLKVVGEEPVPPRQCRPEVPRDLEIICLKCLQKEPGRRYARAGDLADDLRRFRAGEAIRARPASRWETLRRGLRKRREWVYLAGGILLAALLSLGLLVFWPRPAHETRSGPLQEPAAGLPADLRLVPETAFGFVTFRAEDLWKMSDLRQLIKEVAEGQGNPQGPIEELGAQLERSTTLHPRDLERITLVAVDDKGPTRPLVLLRTVRPYSREHLRKTLADSGVYSREEHGGRDVYVPFNAWDSCLCPIDDRVLVLGTTEAVRPIAQSAGTEPGGALRPALDRAAEGHLISAGLQVSPPQLVQLFNHLRLGPESDPVGRLRAVSLVVDRASVAPRVTVEVRADFPDRDRAEAAGPIVPQVARAMLERWEQKPAEWLPPGVLSELFAPLKAAAWEGDGSQLRARADVSWDAEQIKSRARTAVARGLSGENLARIAAALQRYHARHGRLPPAVVANEEGKPLFSWRVLLLPYLGEDALYRRFHLNRAWDHPSNAPLLAKMPSVFRGPRSDAAPDTTPYQAVVGPGGLFDGPEGRSFREVTDGLAQTVLLVEAATPVPWSQPADLMFTADTLPPPDRFGGGLLAAMADGSVHAANGPLTERQLRALLTRAGSEPPENLPLLRLPLLGGGAVAPPRPAR